MTVVSEYAYCCLARRCVKGPLEKQGRIAPLDAKCKIKTGRAPVQRAGKLITPNNTLTFIDPWPYVSSFALVLGFSFFLHHQTHGFGF